MGQNQNFHTIREENQIGLGSPQWNCHFSTGHSFHCHGCSQPYPTQRNAISLSTITPWRAAGQFCFSYSIFSRCSVATYLDIFWKLVSSFQCKLDTNHLCIIHIKRSFLIRTLQTPFSELLPPFNSTLNRKATIVSNNYNKTHPCKTMLLGTLYQFTVISSHTFKETKLTTLFSLNLTSICNY